MELYNLSIDGYRGSFSNAATGCGPSSSESCGPPGAFGCGTANDDTTVDITVDGTGFIDMVYSYNGGGTTPLYMRAGTILLSTFSGGRSTGPWIYAGPATVEANDFFFYGTAGLRVSGTGGSTVAGNYFFENRFEMPDGSGGGQLYIDYGAANNSISDNYIDGNNWVTPARPSVINGCYAPDTPQEVAGIEVEPMSANNQLLGNEITRNPGNGISLHAASSITISGYIAGYGNYPMYIHDNIGNNPPSSGIPTDGIEFYTIGLVPNTSVTLDGVLSRNNSGLGVDMQYGLGSSGPGWSTTDGNCVSSYDPVNSTSTSFTNPTPTSTTTCP